MNLSSIAVHVRTIAAMSEHVESAPLDIGTIDALVAARTLVEVVQVRALADRRDRVAHGLSAATAAIDRTLERL